MNYFTFAREENTISGREKFAVERERDENWKKYVVRVIEMDTTRCNDREGNEVRIELILAGVKCNCKSWCVMITG